MYIKQPLRYERLINFVYAIRLLIFNPLALNDIHIYVVYIYMSYRTDNLQTCILNIYSTNILTEYFKHAAHSPFSFSSICRLFPNAIFFGSCNIHILNTGCAKILKKIQALKG